MLLDYFASPVVREEAHQQALFAIRTKGTGAELYLVEQSRRATSRRSRQVSRLAVAMLSELFGRA